MKNFLEINRALVAKKKVIMLIMAVALMALPAMAQQQEQWQSTSTMQGSGSAYSSQVTAVGATSANEMATTTYSSAKAPGRPRRVIEDDSDPGQLDEGSPIGDAVLPMLLMAMLFAGVIVVRRKRSALNG